jgi:release factor glutamine methyltransferase
MWTVLSLLKEAERFLSEKQVPSPRLEVEILLAYTLSLDRVGLYTHHSRPVEKAVLDRFRSLVLRRIKGEPSAYLTGKKEFFSLPFHVSPAVLIPRPETEETVQVALDHLPGEGAGRRVAEGGTGSGCIIITLLKLKKKLQAIASDISMEALVVAKRNAALHGVQDRLRFFCGNLFSPLKGSCPGGPYHLILCNPPYVDPVGQIPYAPEVAEYEPGQAVFTPPGDPLFYYRQWFESVGPLLGDEGLLIMEIGAGQKDPVVSLAGRLGWSLKEIRKDVAGIDRVISLGPPRNLDP